MRDVNKILLVGRLGADPVRRTTKSGMAVVQFPVATARRLFSEAPQAPALVEGDVQMSEGESLPVREAQKPEPTTDWHRVIVWGRQGEACAQYLRRGAPVYIEGRLQNHKYETKAGEERWSFEVHADEVNFLPSGRSRVRTLEADSILTAAAAG